MVTISYVVPTVLSLNRILESKHFCTILIFPQVHWQRPFFRVYALVLVACLLIWECSNYPAAAQVAVSPVTRTYWLHLWLNDLPGTQAEKEAMRFRVNSMSV